jgi:hypothetical protein
VAWALQVAAGALLPGVNEIGRLNVETSGPSAGRVDQADAARLARKVTGLDANP